MGQYIVAEQEIRLAVLGHDLVGAAAAMKAHRGANALILCHFGDIGRRLDAEHGHALSHEMLQQVAVVARDLHDQTIGPDAEALTHEHAVLAGMHPNVFNVPGTWRR